jgi:hypothetical protein
MTQPRKQNFWTKQINEADTFDKCKAKLKQRKTNNHSRRSIHISHFLDEQPHYRLVSAG